MDCMLSPHYIPRASTQGGGGAGGRIAIVHSQENHFTGEYLIHGGYGREQYGGSGTAYLQDDTNSTHTYRKFIVDNNGHSSSERISSELLSLVSPSSGTNRSYHTYGNILVESTGSPRYISHPLSGVTNTGAPFISSDRTINVTFTLPDHLYIEQVRVYPYCDDSYGRYRSDYWVLSELGGVEVDHTGNYLASEGCQYPDTPQIYGEVDIKRTINKLTIRLHNTDHQASLDQVEFVVIEDPAVNTQTPYSRYQGTAYILHETDNLAVYEFEEIHIQGGGSLAMSGNNAHLKVHQVNGDNTGLMKVKGNQTMTTTQNRALMQFSVLTERSSHLTLPPTIDCRDIDFYIKGHFDVMYNVTLNSGCRMTLDHFKETVNQIENLDIKTFGELYVFTDQEALTTLKGTSLTVRSGAKLDSNDLALWYTNITVEPYGELTVAEAVPKQDKSTGIGAGHCGTACSGGGHGGNGGQGQGQEVVGASHGSFVSPTTFGKDGGYNSFPHKGGKGGGRLFINTTHTLTVDGVISAQGGNWGSVRSGGGSGGSVMVYTYTMDGDGKFDVSGGNGYDGSYTPKAGGGGGGRLAWYYEHNFFVGTFQAFGGTGGYENGGPGTIYAHKMPDREQPFSSFTSNRTLYLDNNNRRPRDPSRNLTSSYGNYTLGSAVAWLIPSEYPSFVNETRNDTQVVLEEFQIYRGAQMAFLMPDNPFGWIDIKIGIIEGDRSGHLHVGFNQSQYIASGKLPNDLSIYHGGDITLKGELRAAGVTISMEGVINNVENLTVVDGGILKIYEMIDVHYVRHDQLVFNTLNVRNNGSMYTENGNDSHNLIGDTLRVFPGGLLESKNLYIEAKTVIIDVLGKISSDFKGHCGGG
ncbi:uncharacterized protein LOC117331111 [Pecten maximus]|uniref:uncharacterized protein LOC117331111 n=1 Tax=Pecten maximus TaxID=6579 RepID=UPI001458E886|nr:uncharacterized protein LOC117331111 [Pecten maximus]